MFFFLSLFSFPTVNLFIYFYIYRGIQEIIFSWSSFDNFNNQFIILTYFYFGNEVTGVSPEFSVKCFHEKHN